MAGGVTGKHLLIHSTPFRHFRTENVTMSALAATDIETARRRGPSWHHRPGVHAMAPTAIAETVTLLEDLSRRAADLAAALPALDLSAHDLTALAGEVQRINARLVDAEERVASAGPAERRG
jgi:hypothetical protein